MNSPLTIVPPLATPQKIGDWTLKETIEALSRPLPRDLLQFREVEDKGKVIQIPYLAWHNVARILDKYSPGWEWEVKHTTHDTRRFYLTGKLTLRTSEGLFSREATGSEKVTVDSFGDPSSNAEGMAFRRAAAKFGLGLYLYNKKKR